VAKKISRKRSQFHLSIPSEQKNIHMVEDFLIRVSKSFHLSEEKLYLLLVVVTEAVNNGINHGNKRDPSKNVDVVCTVRGTVLTVSIRDEGKGFDPSLLPNPIAEENLLRDSGRGVFLMQQLMDTVKYREGGREVVMTMRLRK
jgi:serine/threonine-protein kinase RsbW